MFSGSWPLWVGFVWGGDEGRWVTKVGRAGWGCGLSGEGKWLTEVGGAGGGAGRGVGEGG